MLKKVGYPVRAKLRGQGMTEYIIVVALIAIAAIGVYQFFGQTVRNQTAGIALELSGRDAGQAITAAQGAAGNAQTQANVDKGLDAYNND
jgi:type II secretory pathway pseudopilin PulG